MKKTNRYLAGAAVLAALGVAADVVAPRARAQDVSMIPTGQFGMMGAVRGEIGRLSVTNVNLFPPDPCHAILAFVDAAGNVMRRPDGSPVQKEVTLAAGHSAFLQFNASNFIPADETRLNFRPVVFIPPPDNDLPSDPCVPSVEVIASDSGRTRLLSAGGARMGGPEGHNHNETLVEDR